MIYFIKDKYGKSGHPTKKGQMITRKLKNGAAKIISRTKDTLTVQFLDKEFKDEDTVNAEFRVGIDPGMTIGFSLYKIYKEKITLLLSGHLESRSSDITKNLAERKMYRNIRRRYRRKNVKRKFGKAKFRKPVWKNCAKHDFQPTHIHLIRTHVNLIKWFKKRIPLNKIHIEYAKFDMHKMMNPKVFSFWYQKGEQYMCNSVKDYVRKRDNYVCRVCKDKKSITEVHHIIPRREGGSDRPGNQITLCPKCHTKADNNSISRRMLFDLIKKSSTVNLKQAGVLNSCMKAMFELLEKRFATQNTFGSITKTVRQFNNLDKTHEIDAQIIGLSDSIAMQDIEDYEYIDLDNHMYGKQYRRHDRAWVKRLEDRKYYVLDMIKGKSKVIAWNRAKRTSQIKDSLTDFRKNNLGNVTVKPGRKIYKRGNINRKFVPGDLVRYKDIVDICKGWASTQGKVILEKCGYVRQRECTVIRRNSGMILI